MNEKERESIESLRDWAWYKVRQLMKADLYNDSRAFIKFADAVESTHRFLVDVCGMSCEEAAIPADIYEVYGDICDLEDEDEEFEDESHE